MDCRPIYLCRYSVVVVYVMMKFVGNGRWKVRVGSCKMQSHYVNVISREAKCGIYLQNAKQIINNGQHACGLICCFIQLHQCMEL